jgi:ABC-type dipeptide/oligopeptide/nickel transport system permease component
VTLFILRTLLKMVLTLFVIVTLVFFATRLSGSPLETFLGEGLTAEDREMMITYFGLEGSIWEQYLRYLRGLAEGNFGLSFMERRPVAEIVAERVGPSLQLLLASLAFTVAVSIPLGVLAAIWRRRWVGSAIMTLAFIGYAVPNFVIATFLILLLSFTWNLLPVVGNGTWAHFIMPTLAMSGVLVAALTRFTRNAMLDVLGQDFMRTARAKGLPETVVIVKHGLRNAGVTVISVLGLQIAGLAAAGNVVVEAIFSWPGIGELLVTAAIMRDYPVLQFGVIAVAVAVVVINALTDIAYAAVDPRVRLSKR